MMMNNPKEKALIVQYKEEISQQLSDPETLKSLMEVTFKGLEPAVAKRAMLEGYFRGFKFVDFLKKDVYAIPFKDAYSLVTSIDHARKIGMRSGVIGKSAPVFEMNGKKIESCSITIKRKIGEEIGEFTSLVYFDEYYKAGYSGKPSLWDTKPRTMIAKVAEMHAIRMACPEELAKVYTEEEFDKEKDAEPVKYTVMRKQEPFEEHEEKPNLILHQNSRNEQTIDADTMEEIVAKTDK